MRCDYYNIKNMDCPTKARILIECYLLEPQNHNNGLSALT
jgi:hypothetical protein